jgi:hypothetical protein
MLEGLRFKDVGPAPSLDVALSERLNIFTGDNGLGKTFILEVAWWALTGTWASHPASPRVGGDADPTITVEFRGRTGADRAQLVSKYQYSKQEWHRKEPGIDVPSMVVYARIDGSFSVWDPARNLWDADVVARRRPASAFHFTPKDVWDGLPPMDDQAVCNGLIRDWVYWQLQQRIEDFPGGARPGADGKHKALSQFALLENLVVQLVATPGEPVTIGEPVRLSVFDVRDIPTLVMPYGKVPLVLASAGQKRIVGLAYLLTWAWDEHKKASRLRNQAPVDRIVLLIDELESHLHPQWQRAILPALLGLGQALEARAKIQILATTHAPLILASIEPHFDRDRDSLFLLELERAGPGPGPGREERRVTLQKLPWASQGDAVAWLTSPVFGLAQARSREAETAIEAAEAFMRGDRKQLPAGLKTKAAIQKALERSLPGLDPFWPRWIVEAPP